MRYTSEKVTAAYERTNGCCHICRARLAFSNYGSPLGSRGAWEIDHSVPKSKGGSDHGNNLFAACISCNRSKRAGSTRAARAAHGYQSAPKSAVKLQEERNENALLGSMCGGLLGLFFGPVGLLVGAATGGIIGYESKGDAA